MSFAVYHDSKRPVVRAALLLACLLICLAGSACSGRVSTDTIRASLHQNDLTPLREKMEQYAVSNSDMIAALNLARLYQLEGKWQHSIAMFNRALMLLEDYEKRALINIRSMAAGAGTVLLARGAQEYFGTGYERSLLHTFNALNYLMLGDMDAAAVELRKMEQRQEQWLLESSARIERHVDALRASRYETPDQLPSGYSMRRLLADPAVQNMLNSYQDPFSYLLSSLVARIAADPAYAQVSAGRAVALQPGLGELYRQAWPPVAAAPAPAAPAEKNTPASRRTKAPTAPRPAIEAVEDKGYTPGGPLPPLPRPPQLQRGEPEYSAGRPYQELVIISFSGLAPALHVEHIRAPFPYVGYVVIDLPAFTPPLQPPATVTVTAADGPVSMYPLLRTDHLAYRTLADEIKFEIGSALSRAMVRAGSAAAARAAMSSRKETRDYAPLAGVLTTAVLDLFSVGMADSVRNWELLPLTGSVGMRQVPRGSTIHIAMGHLTKKLALPVEAQGVIIMISQLSNNTMRVDHVAY